MNITFSLLLTLILNATTAVCCAALAMLVFWQDARRRSNQLFALVMFFFCVYVATIFLFRFNSLFHYPEALGIYLRLTLLGLSYLAMVVFALDFSRLPRRTQQAMHVWGISLGSVLLVLLWSGKMYQHFETLPDQSISYLLTPIGAAALILMTSYPTLGAWLLFKAANERSRILWPMVLLMPLASTLNALPALQPLSLNSAAMLLIALGTARLIMHEHVFKPMNEINLKLAAANDELARVNLLKSQFLATMSHELRTPLNSVIGYTELVISGLYGPLTERQADRLEKVGRNGRRLLALINDVLDLSKIEAGHMILTREPLILADYVKLALETAKADADAKGITLTSTVSRNLPRVTADPLRLEQILNNLVSNAVKFTSVGGVTLSAERDQNNLLFTIADTGIGIPPDRQPAIFEVFAGSTPDSPDAINLDHSDGTGLGLALTRNLVEMHKGRIWCESEGIPGKGATFYVTLPLASTELEKIKPQIEALGPAILCIDDSRDAIEVMLGMLEPEGFRVYGAHNGPEGVQRALELIPAVIILDIMMPAMDGWQVIRALRADSTTVDIPVVIASTLDQSNLAEAMGAVGCLTKPFKRAGLLGTINTALDLKGKTDLNRAAALADPNVKREPTPNAEPVES